MILYCSRFCSYLYIRSGQVKRIFGYDCCIAMQYIMFVHRLLHYDENCGFNGQNRA